MQPCGSTPNRGHRQLTKSGLLGPGRMSTNPNYRPTTEALRGPLLIHGDHDEQEKSTGRVESAKSHATEQKQGDGNSIRAGRKRTETGRSICRRRRSSAEPY